MFQSTQALNRSHWSGVIAYGRKSMFYALSTSLKFNLVCTKDAAIKLSTVSVLGHNAGIHMSTSYHPALRIAWDAEQNSLGRAKRQRG